MAKIEVFSKSYKGARDKFLRAAEAWGGPLESHHLPGHKGAMGEDLYIDTVWQGPRDAARLLILTSAVHGVEGYAGSALQTTCLQKKGLLSGRDDVAILHVHALNPYGFSFDRRANENNVDLNRNLLNWDEPVPVEHPLLPVVQAALTSPHKGLKNFISVLLLLRHGVSALQEALTEGQYTYPDSLFYGGDRLQWSNAKWQDTVQREASVRDVVAHVDIHTGLGKAGTSEIIVAAPASSPAYAQAVAWWGKVTSPYNKTAISAPLRGEIATIFNQLAGPSLSIPVTLEFGTTPPWQVLKALRADMQPCDEKQKESVRSMMRQAFYPQSRKWKKAVLDQGFQTIDAALKGLSSLKI